MDPRTNLIDEESSHLMLCLCTFISNCEGKKLSLQNVFITLLKEDKYRRIFKSLLTLETDMELVQMFIKYDPTIVNSKYISKFLNSPDSKKLDLIY